MASALAITAAGLLALEPCESTTLALLFRLRGSIPKQNSIFPNDVSIVALPEGTTGDWTPYTKILNELVRAHAKAAVFDIAFTGPAWNQGSSRTITVDDLNTEDLLAQLESARVGENEIVDFIRTNLSSATLQARQFLSGNQTNLQLEARESLPAFLASDFQQFLTNRLLARKAPLLGLPQPAQENEQSLREVNRSILEKTFPQAIATNATIREFERAIDNARHAGVQIIFGATSQLSHDGPAIQSVVVGPEFLRFDPNGIRIACVEQHQRTGMAHITRYQRQSRIPAYATMAYATAAALKEPSTPDEFILNYYGPPGTLPWINFSELDSSRSADSRLARRVVFVGDGPPVAPLCQYCDRHLSPVSSSAHSMAGVEIQATAYANLTSELPLSIASHPEYLVILIGFAAAVVFSRLPPSRAAILALVTGAFSVELSIVLFKYQYFFPGLTVAGPQMLCAWAVSWLPIRSVFISYRGKDAAFAQIIEEGLAERGVEVFVDHKEPGLGRLQKTLLPEVQRRSALCLIVTPYLVQSFPKPLIEDDWVGEEIARAREQNIPILGVYFEGANGALVDETADRPYSSRFSTVERFSLRDVLSGQWKEDYLAGPHKAASIMQILSHLSWHVRKTSHSTRVRVQ